jgi:hypothetical protein
MDEQADFVTKLQQIEEIAQAGGSDLNTKAHLRQIALIAKTLRQRLELGVAFVVPSAVASLPPEKDKPRT